MRSTLALILAASIFSLFATDVSLALPTAVPSTPSVQASGESDVQDSRLYCYNRYTGRFLHWGPCGGYRRPRVYCYNRYTGRFLHWGACY
jgi:hypothetical protein